jgi:hypothetical protein
MLTITPPMNPQSTTREASMLTITPPMNPQSTTREVSMLTITPPMIYHMRGEHANHYTTNDLPSMLASRVVDCGFIGGVMVSMLTSRVVDRGFIGGVMVSMLASRVVDRGFESRSGQTKEY